MFKDDDESKLECEDVPVDRGEVALLVSKSFVETVRLEWKIIVIKGKITESTDSAVVSPVFCRCPRQGELNEALHLPVPVVISVHQLGDEVAGEGNEKGLGKGVLWKYLLEIVTDIADHRQLSDHLHDGEPDPDVLGSLRHRPPGLTDKLLGVQSDLHPVVEQRKERRQREGRNEDCYETKLQD